MKRITSLLLVVSAVAHAHSSAINWNWDPGSLNKQLYPIAYLESSFGKYVNHQPHSKGPFYSSYGTLGLKAVTAYEAYLISKRLQEKWKDDDGHVLSQDEFFNIFTVNEELYNDCANVHWWYLSKHTDSIEQAAFAWRWGLGAALEASNDTIITDKYVQSYSSFTGSGLRIVKHKVEPPKMYLAVSVHETPKNIRQGSSLQYLVGRENEHIS